MSLGGQRGNDFFSGTKGETRIFFRVKEGQLKYLSQDLEGLWSNSLLD